MKRELSLIAILALAGAIALVFNSLYQSRASATSGAQGEQWEYLVVAGGNVNLNPSDSGTLRKMPGVFNREAFPLQQNMDKLGAKGWELVSVSGSPGDPTLYFKRRK